MNIEAIKESVNRYMVHIKSYLARPVQMQVSDNTHNVMEALYVHDLEIAKLWAYVNNDTKAPAPFPLKGKPINKLNKEDVQWIVNGDGELGVRIGEQMFFLYKQGSIEFEESFRWRKIEKREFGESCVAPKLKKLLSDLEENEDMDDNDETKESLTARWSRSYEWQEHNPAPDKIAEACNQLLVNLAKAMGVDATGIDSFVFSDDESLSDANDWADTQECIGINFVNAHSISARKLISWIASRMNTAEPVFEAVTKNDNGYIYWFKPKTLSDVHVDVPLEISQHVAKISYE